MIGKGFVLLSILLISNLITLKIVYSIDSSEDIDKLYEKMKVSQLKDIHGFVNYYTFKSRQELKSKKLIIYLEGSTKYSVIGAKENDKWKEIGIASFIVEYFNNNYDLFLPGRYNVPKAKGFNINEKKIMKYYNLTYRVKAARKCIDHYLTKNPEYEKCYIIGASEGSIIASKVYNELKNQVKISKIFLLCGGGMSQYEQFKILYKSYNPPYKEALKNIDMIVRDIKQNPNSLQKHYLGWPYKRWSEFMFYRPIDDIVKIKIPIVVMHGDNDNYAAIESSRLIKLEFEKLEKNNLIYKEYKGYNHSFNNEFNSLFEEINTLIS